MRAWQQEAIDVEQAVLVDDTHAVCDESTLRRLPEYSCTTPTGTRIGKRWRRWCEWETGGHLTGRWLLGEYFDLGRTDRVGIKWRELMVV